MLIGAHVSMSIFIVLGAYLASYPGPFSEKEEQWPGTHCLLMHQNFRIFSSKIFHKFDTPRGLVSELPALQVKFSMLKQCVPGPFLLSLKEGPVYEARRLPCVLSSYHACVNIEVGGGNVAIAHVHAKLPIRSI